MANKPPSSRRVCDRCGRPYNRANMVRAWPVTNWGKRDGWVRVILRVCTRPECMGDQEALMLVRDVDPKWRVPKS